jgi:hypothetical protein
MKLHNVASILYSNEPTEIFANTTSFKLNSEAKMSNLSVPNPNKLKTQAYEDSKKPVIVTPVFRPPSRAGLSKNLALHLIQVCCCHLAGEGGYSCYLPGFDAEYGNEST